MNVDRPSLHHIFADLSQLLLALVVPRFVPSVVLAGRREVTPSAHLESLSETHLGLEVVIDGELEKHCRLVSGLGGL